MKYANLVNDIDRIKEIELLLTKLIETLIDVDNYYGKNSAITLEAKRQVSQFLREMIEQERQKERDKIARSRNHTWKR